jgi:hypothetical protein
VNLNSSSLKEDSFSDIYKAVLKKGHGLKMFLLTFRELGQSPTQDLTNVILVEFWVVTPSSVVVHAA